MPGRDVEVADETGRVPEELRAELERAALATLSAEGIEDAALSIALVSDATISAMNHRYLSHDGPTDVISFPLEGPEGNVVGDVYVGLDQAERQAGELGLPAREELIRLVVHGTLHVLGWEHPEELAEREKSPMYLRQEELVREVLSRRSSVVSPLRRRQPRAPAPDPANQIDDETAD